MSTNDDIYHTVGEALSLAQRLEFALTIPIMMLFLLESGEQRDIGPEEMIRLVEELEGKSFVVKPKPIDEKFRQNLRLKLGQITMLVQNGTMGELKRAIESRLHISPGGPSVFLDVLQEALDARNYLCHEFFKEYGPKLHEENARFDAIAKLDGIQASIRKAISFTKSLEHTLFQHFPKTFAAQQRNLH